MTGLGGVSALARGTTWTVFVCPCVCAVWAPLRRFNIWKSVSRFTRLLARSVQHVHGYMRPVHTFYHLVPFIPPSKLTCEVLRGNSVNLGMAPADPDKALNALRRLAANKRCGSCPYEERMGFKDV